MIWLTLTEVTSERYGVKSMPLISERTTHAGARVKSILREENSSRREETRARELISNTRTRMTCSLRAHDHSPHARPCLFLSVMGRGLLV